MSRQAGSPKAGKRAGSGAEGGARANDSDSDDPVEPSEDSASSDGSTSDDASGNIYLFIREEDGHFKVGRTSNLKERKSWYGKQVRPGTWKDWACIEGLDSTAAESEILNHEKVEKARIQNKESDKRTWTEVLRNGNGEDEITRADIEAIILEVIEKQKADRDLDDLNGKLEDAHIG